MLMNLEQYRLIVESSPNMIWRSNLSTECDYFNKTWLDFTGRTFEQEQGFGWAAGVHPDDYDRCVKIYLDNFKNQSRFEMDYRLKRYDGQYRWINDRGVPFYNRQGKFIGFIGSCMDVTEKIEGQILKNMAQRDYLCDTYNRQYSLQLLTEAFGVAKEKGLPLSVLMIDIDNFKSINDEFGHIAGDQVLTHVASIIKNETREYDIFGRYGGDELICGLINTKDFDAVLIANRIKNEIMDKEFKTTPSTIIPITISIGVSSLKNEQNLNELISKADINLYHAKKRGKNLVVNK